MAQDIYKFFPYIDRPPSQDFNIKYLFDFGSLKIPAMPPLSTFVPLNSEPLSLPKPPLLENEL